MAKNEDLKVSSPYPEMIAETYEIDTLKEKIKGLQDLLIREKTERKKLEKRLEHGLSDTERVKVVFDIKKDEQVQSLTDRMLTLDYQNQEYEKSLMRLENETKLLKESRHAIMDQYEMSEEYRKTRAQLKIETDKLNELMRQIDLAKERMAQEEEDIKKARQTYIQTYERWKQVKKLLRDSMHEYNEVRQKFLLPPLADSLPRFEEEKSKKKGFAARIKSKLRRSR